MKETSENNIKEYLYVMDYSDGSISEIEITEKDKDLESCDLLDKYGFKDSECSWMFTTERITKINKIDRK